MKGSKLQLFGIQSVANKRTNSSLPVLTLQPTPKTFFHRINDDLSVAVSGLAMGFREQRCVCVFIILLAEIYVFSSYS